LKLEEYIRDWTHGPPCHLFNIYESGAALLIMPSISFSTDIAP
jgi:hypothetical protein